MRNDLHISTSHQLKIDLTTERNSRAGAIIGRTIVLGQVFGHFVCEILWKSSAFVDIGQFLQFEKSHLRSLLVPPLTELKAVVMTL